MRFSLSATMKGIRKRLRTPRAVAAKKRRRRISKAAKRSVRKRLSFTKRVKRRRNNGLTTNGAFTTTIGKRSIRRIRKRDRRLLAQSKEASCRSHYSNAYSALSAVNRQGITYFNVGEGSTGIPTVDPGASLANVWQKIWWDQTGNATGNRTRPFYIYGNKVKIQIRSASETPVKFTIYSLVARRDHEWACDTLWNQGLTDTIKQSSTVAAGTAATATTPGVTPFMSTPFCQFYKVVSSKTITLEGGQCHHHYEYQPVNRMINGEFFQFNTDKFRKGLSYVNMIVFQGTLSADGEGDVGIPPVKLLVKLEVDVKWKLVDETNRDQLYFFETGAFDAAINTAGLREVNPETGQLDTNVQMA